MPLSIFFSIEQEYDLPTVPVCGRNPSFVHRSRGGDRTGMRDTAQEGNGGSETSGGS